MKKKKEGKKRNTRREEESQVFQRETETIDLCTPRAHSGAVKAPNANTLPGTGLQTPYLRGNQRSAGAGELARGGGSAGGDAGLVLVPIGARALPPVPEVALETPGELGWPVRGRAARDHRPRRRRIPRGGGRAVQSDPGPGRRVGFPWAGKPDTYRRLRPTLFLLPKLLESI